MTGSCRETHRSVAEVLDPTVEVGCLVDQRGEIVVNGGVEVRTGAWGGQVLQELRAETTRRRQRTDP